MDKCGAYNLREVSEDAAKAYYEQLKMTHCCPLLHTTAADNVDNSVGRRKK